MLQGVAIDVPRLLNAGKYIKFFSCFTTFITRNEHTGYVITQLDFIVFCVRGPRIQQCCKRYCTEVDVM